MFYQLKFISPSASDAAIATQVGILVGAKTASKVGTGIVWGRLADANYGGRKLVLLIGLTTSCKKARKAVGNTVADGCFFRSRKPWLWLLFIICHSSLLADILGCDEQ